MIFLWPNVRYDNYAIRNCKENKPEVVILSARERILALRLLEKQKKNPKIAKQIGIEVKMTEKNEKKN